MTRAAGVTTSRAAIRAGRIGRFFLVVLVLSVAAHRFGLVDTNTGVVLLGISLLGAAAALGYGIAGIMRIWQRGDEGVGQAIAGVVLGLAILAVPTYYLLLMMTTPRLTDVTTDITDPPAFYAVLAERPADANPLDYLPPANAGKQIEAYPDIRSLRVNAAPLDAHDAAYVVAEEFGWDIVAEVQPPDGGEGRIEAVARTLLMGFRDDIAIRVRPDEGGSVIDMRSASRFGKRDFGTNARRIRAFLHAVRRKLAPTAGGEK